jgi:hypothetical protein
VYEAHPSYPSQVPLPEPAPTSVRVAVYLMCAGAVVCLISGIASLIAAVNEAPKILDGARSFSGSPGLGEAVRGLRIVVGRDRHAVAALGVLLLPERTALLGASYYVRRSPFARRRAMG